MARAGDYARKSVMCWFIAVLVLSSGCVAPDAGSTPSPQRASHTYTYQPLNFKVRTKYQVFYHYEPKGDIPELKRQAVNAFQANLEREGNSGFGYEFAEGTPPDLFIELHFYNAGDDNLRAFIRATGQSARVPAVMAEDGSASTYCVRIAMKYSYRNPETMLDDAAHILDCHIVNECSYSNWHPPIESVAPDSVWDLDRIWKGLDPANFHNSVR